MEVAGAPYRPTGAGPLIWADRSRPVGQLLVVDGVEAQVLVARPVTCRPEAKTVKNRVHWVRDTRSPCGGAAGPGRGGDVESDVLADPEGNEFCVFSR